jgi:endonuclease/exonuclease/phosphatase family metal-dependent hydrolase
MFKLFLLSLLLTACDAITVGTFNIRVPVDGPPNDYQSRIPRISSLIKKYNVDIIGLQEAAENTVSDLLKALPGYCKINQPVYDNAIIYKCDIKAGESKIWAISSTPEVIGSNSYGLAYPRTLVWSQFNVGPTTQIAFYATHLDIIPKVIQQDFVNDRICETYNGRSVVLVGDFNTDNIQPFIDNGLKDTSGIGPTFNGFGGYGGPKIDYILVSKDIINSKGNIVYDKVNDQFASDHAFVIASL